MKLLASEGGFTLVEMMIAMTIGLMLLAGMVTYFVNASGNQRELQRSGQQIENGRYALDSLIQDLHLAGFYGPYIGYTTPGALPDSCDTAPAVMTAVTRTRAAAAPIRNAIKSRTPVPSPVEIATARFRPSERDGCPESPPSRPRPPGRPSGRPSVGTRTGPSASKKSPPLDSSRVAEPDRASLPESGAPGTSDGRFEPILTVGRSPSTLPTPGRPRGDESSSPPDSEPVAPVSPETKSPDILSRPTSCPPGASPNTPERRTGPDASPISSKEKSSLAVIRDSSRAPMFESSSASCECS